MKHELTTNEKAGTFCCLGGLLATVAGLTGYDWRIASIVLGVVLFVSGLQTLRSK